jgi:hypothetical protein
MVSLSEFWINILGTSSKQLVAMCLKHNAKASMLTKESEEIYAKLDPG